MDESVVSEGCAVIGPVPPDEVVDVSTGPFEEDSVADAVIDVIDVIVGSGLDTALVTADAAVALEPLDPTLKPGRKLGVIVAVPL